MKCKLVAEYPVGGHVIVVGEVLKVYKTSNKSPMIWGIPSKGGEVDRGLCLQSGLSIMFFSIIEASN